MLYKEGCPLPQCQFTCTVCILKQEAVSSQDICTSVFFQCVCGFGVLCSKATSVALGYQMGDFYFEAFKLQSISFINEASSDHTLCHAKFIVIFSFSVVLQNNN